MKIIISYPPLNNQKGYPTLGQNRQFQFFKEPTYIYPVVPASAATLLKEAGHEVVWNDCIAENRSYAQYLEFIKTEKPDLLAFETKTPVVRRHWGIINDIKGLSPKGTVPKTVLFGDHVTALPEESFQNSEVDFVLTGGDYDFLLRNLCNVLSSSHCEEPPATKQSQKRDCFASSRLAMTELEPGIYYRDNETIRNTGKFRLNHDLNSLPFIDRDLTRWQLYAYKNGNYKRAPGTYIMSGRDCWWGKCAFCSWPALYPEFRSRSVDNVLDEIGQVITRYGIREVMDDSGSLPAGDWLRDFCRGAIKRGYREKIYLDANMRFGALSEDDFRLMKRANFRLLLFGLESASQDTLDRLNKNVKKERIIEDCRLAAKAGLYPHITIMFGYPWETYQDALNTLKLGKWLLRKGYAYTMQATVVIPYPGTPLFKECREKGLLNTLDWDDYDMKAPVMRAPVPEEEIMGFAQRMYKVSFNPEFVLRRLFSLRDIDDAKYGFRALKKVIGHIFDFNQIPLTKHNGVRQCPGR